MMMVMHLLKLTQKPQIDASDALAIALTHDHTRSRLIPHGMGTARRERKSDVYGKSVDLGGRRIIKKKKLRSNQALHPAPV